MRFAVVTLVWIASGCAGGPSASTGDAGFSDDAGARRDAPDANEEGPIPPAPDTPGCAMTIDGDRSLGTANVAMLQTSLDGPSLRLICAEIDLEISRPKSGEVQIGTANFSRHGAEYRGPCTVRLDKLAVRDRGGLAARVRCDLPLARVLQASSMVHPPTRRVDGYVVMPKANALAPTRAEGGNHHFCTYETTGEYRVTGRGSSFATRCVDEAFALDTDVPYAAISGSFCPSCTTFYEGSCTRRNVVIRDEATQVVASDVTCDFSHELAGELHVTAHLEGPVVTTP
ncbi:MAG: hypothetical protein U0183_13640 [Polyangiaceae bacterium]